MDNAEKIRIVNERMKGNNVGVPKSLFKYRPFDKYAFDMLENNYLFLCQAAKLDDKSECSVSFDIKDYYDIATDQLTRRCVNQIMELVHPYTKEENFVQMKNIVDNVLLSNGQVKRNCLIDASFNLQDLVPGIDIAPLINQLANIPERIDNPEIRTQIEKLFSMALLAREKIGVCSLTTENNNDQMWNDYASQSVGYCVEYDMVDYEFNKLLFPVVYIDQRENNVLINIIDDFIGQIIQGMSNGQIDADISKYLRMFITKDTTWQHQKEWRLIGDADEKIRAPRIKTIYIGKNAQLADRERMKVVCNKKEIQVYQC